MKHILPLIWLLLSTSLAADPLLRSTGSWDGGSIAYPEGDAEITSVILRLEEGADPPFHCHPVPTMGYVLKGTAEIETEGGQTRRIGAGEALVEVMHTVHRGRAIGGPAEIVIFYAGAVGVPVTVMPEQDPEGQYCR
jgi:quercetin dioxygenase-like cupin family protein